MAEDNSARVEFEGAHGELLAGRLDRAPGRPRAHALFVHCFTCSKDFVASARVARALAALGVSVLRFDFTGLGNSAGDFANTSFSSNVEDLVRAADFLRREHEAPAGPAHVTDLFAERREEIHARGEAEVTLAGRRFRIRRQLLDDLAAASLEPAVANLRKALLVLHSPVDATVGIENASRLFQRARHPKSFVALDRADHLLTRREDAAWAAAMIAAWASRFLPGPRGSGPVGPFARPAGVRRGGSGRRHAETAPRQRQPGRTPLSTGWIEKLAPMPLAKMLGGSGVQSGSTKIGNGADGEALLDVLEPAGDEPLEADCREVDHEVGTAPAVRLTETRSAKSTGGSG